MEQDDKIVLNIYICFVDALYKTPLPSYHSYDQHGSNTILAHPVLRPKLDAHRMCAQDQDFTHMTRITTF
jgi:hypothetical protein